MHLQRYSWWVRDVSGGNVFFKQKTAYEILDGDWSSDVCSSDLSHYTGSQLAGGVFIFLCVIRRHFLACEDIAGGSELLAAVTFFCEIQRPFRWVPNVRWRNHYFARNKEAFPCVRPWTQLSASPRTVHFR